MATLASKTTTAPKSGRSTARPSGEKTGTRKPRAPRRPDDFGPRAERDFLKAMERYKQSSGRMFPTWSEVLEVLTSLGYQKAAPSSQSSPTAREKD